MKTIVRHNEKYYLGSRNIAMRDGIDFNDS